MGDDVGWFNIGAYHRGIMSGKTPNLDKLAAEGMLFTDYYAEASCTAGRANFITGELPLRTGLTTVLPCTLSARKPNSSQKYTSPPEAFACLAMAGYRSCRHASIASGSRW